MSQIGETAWTLQTVKQCLEDEHSSALGARLAPLIDAHIHLDSYEETQQREILAGLKDTDVEGLIAVSMQLDSARNNLKLAQDYPLLVHPAFGLHPEQAIPGEAEINRLFAWMKQHTDEMIAVGEVGLPYYTRKEAEESGQTFDSRPYEELLERFIAFARDEDKPIVLHAVYEDADTTCRLLEEYDVRRAHFHWFKGSPETALHMAERGYYISFTPDIAYEEEIQELARVYPAKQVMSETDGPWPFEGPFAGQMTHPQMTADVAAAWSRIQGLSLPEARRILHANAKHFYRI
ncbi:TatD family hydrolase [Paenibacillus sp.]|jgi:TatD DNase family protein|uniref:TatD family hydrolase n=1 Tax=Paenibacillus sp. TaxID=58172 RepID=UPI00283A25F7|nr:TatD family hydrolase [Paenibacillus sp.]MDR0269071.1 TatD family hydrolase [Paenibacillus sp.]